MTSVTAVRVAIVDEHDIFRRGLVVALNEAVGVDVVYAAQLGPIDVECDIIVASRGGAGTVDLGLPMVLCVDNVVSTPVGAYGGTIHALLSRALLTPRRLEAAVLAAAQGFRVNAAMSSGSSLDDRSQSVLRLLAGGAQTREISDALGYSERTIKGVIKRLQDQLGARSRAQVVAHGIRDGLI